MLIDAYNRIKTLFLAMTGAEANFETRPASLGDLGPYAQPAPGNMQQMGS
jgi:hypothetical protein